MFQYKPNNMSRDMDAFWHICVERDLEAFLAKDWSITAVDFNEDQFLGVDSHGSNNPLDWEPKYASLLEYRDEFYKQADEFSQLNFAEDPRVALYRSLLLSEPKISGDCALIVKTFNGEIALADNDKKKLAWKSAFNLKRTNGRWLITGFVGYLPL